MHLDEGKQHSRRCPPAIDRRKVERLKKLARETEMLAMELVCEVYSNVTGAGHMEPPVPDDGGGATNGNGRRYGSGEPNPPSLGSDTRDGRASLHGAGHQEPPVPILDALVCVAHGAKEVCDGCDKLS